MLRFLVRGLLGSFFITVFSSLAAVVGIILPVGVNIMTFLSCGLLGIPGIILIYGLCLIQMYV